MVWELSFSLLQMQIATVCQVMSFWARPNCSQQTCTTSPFVLCDSGQHVHYFHSLSYFFLCQLCVNITDCLRCNSSHFPCIFLFLMVVIAMDALPCHLELLFSWFLCTFVIQQNLVRIYVQCSPSFPGTRGGYAAAG